MIFQCGRVQSYDNVLEMSLKINETVLYVQNFEKQVLSVCEVNSPSRRVWDGFSVVPKFY